MSSASPIVELEAVTRTYRQGELEVHALRGLDLKVYPGEFLALCGPSGSGKTTALNLIGALDRPSGGRVLLEGRDLGRLSASDRSVVRRDRIGFVFQAYNLIPVLSAYENAEMVLALQGVPERERQARVMELLAEVGLKGAEHRRPDQLSGGQQQRVAIVRAIAARPAVVLADEPTANVDSETAGRLLDTMERLNRERGVTFLFSTHDPRVMERATRLVRLVDGSVESDESRGQGALALRGAARVEQPRLPTAAGSLHDARYDQASSPRALRGRPGLASGWRQVLVCCLLFLALCGAALPAGAELSPSAPSALPALDAGESGANEGMGAPAERPPSIDLPALLDRVDDLYRGASSVSTMRMTVHTRRWERTLRLKTWSRGKEHSLIRILSPRKEAGAATLKAGRNIWNYLPKVSRVVKLPSSMMGGSWMGSHLSNDDLVRDSRLSEGYTHRLLAGPGADGEGSWEVECLARPDAAVVWGKVVASVRARDEMPVSLRYYDEDGALARTLSFEGIKELDGRRMPSRMRIVPADLPDEYTEVEYEELDFDVRLPDSTFSLRALRR